MKNLQLKKIITTFMFMLLISALPAANALEKGTYSEVYVPELMEDGSVVFTKKPASEPDQPAAPTMKLRSASVKCCADVPIRTPSGTTVVKLCRQISGTQCPAGTYRQ